MGGRWSSIVNRVVCSTNVPIAVESEYEVAGPVVDSPLGKLIRGLITIKQYEKGGKDKRDRESHAAQKR